MIDYIQVGNRIRHYRLLRGFTQEDLAFYVHSSPVYISNIERAVKKPSLEKLCAIAEALDITLNQLLTSPEKVNPTGVTADVLSSIITSPDTTKAELFLSLYDLLKEKDS